MLGTKIGFTQCWEHEYSYLVLVNDSNAITTKTESLERMLKAHPNITTVVFNADVSLKAISYENRTELFKDIVNSIMCRELSGSGTQVSNLELSFGRGFISGQYSSITGREFGFEMGIFGTDSDYKLDLNYDVFEGIEDSELKAFIEVAKKDANSEQLEGLNKLEHYIFNFD